MIAGWLGETLATTNHYLGRTGVFPAVAAIAAVGDNLLHVEKPSAEYSSLLNLLNTGLPDARELATAIEPPAEEGDQIVALAKRRETRELYFGALNPSPKDRGIVSGKLQAAGIAVHHEGADERVAESDRRYWVWASSGRPYVHLKISLTAEGAAIVQRGFATRLAGPESLTRIHRLRGQYDALLLGAQTIRNDDPQMTYRGPDDYSQPQKIILSNRESFPEQGRAFQGNSPWICGGDLWTLALDWGRRRITSVLVEGGLRVFDEFIEPALVDEISLVWTRRQGGPGGLRLQQQHLPYGPLEHVGEDVWETIRWPAMSHTHPSPFSRDV